MPLPVIYHLTDLSGDDEAAFLHACALAASSEARFVTLHGNAPETDVGLLPDASVVSRRWGRQIAHERICHECCDDVIDTVLDALRRVEPALVVTGSHARHGLAALVHDSRSAAIARNVDVPTLIAQNHRRGFVDAATGAIDLRRVHVPAGTRDEAIHGITAARNLLRLAGVQAEIEVIHAISNDAAFELPDLDVLVTQTHGKVEDVVLAAAHERDARLIVMVSRGHDGILDVLRGSHTEHVIRDAGCPVLYVPMS